MRQNGNRVSLPPTPPDRADPGIRVSVHVFVLQELESDNVGHAVPPHEAAVVVDLERYRVPPPHVTGQAPQALHELTTQLTAAQRQKNSVWAEE